MTQLEASVGETRKYKIVCVGKVAIGCELASIAKEQTTRMYSFQPTESLCGRNQKIQYCLSKKGSTKEQTTRMYSFEPTQSLLGRIRTFTLLFV